MDSVDKITANPNILASDISILYAQTSETKMYLYSDIARSSPDIKSSFFTFMEKFYALVDRTSHHLDEKVDKEYHEFFDRVLVFKSTDDEEEEFYGELVAKGKEMMSMFEKYKRLLKDRGILDLVHQLDVGGLSR